MSDALLERKEYLVGLTIIEARAIQGKNYENTSDPFIRVKCANQIQQTSKKYEVNSAVWNQTLTFNGIQMNQYELETFELNLEMFDHNDVFLDTLIGQYSIGLSTLYRMIQHEIYKKWLPIFNREQPNVIQAYVLISAFIVGPDDVPPVHAADEDYDPDAQDPDSDEDEDAVKKRIESIKKAQWMLPVYTPQMIDKKYQLTIKISQGSGLPKCEEGVKTEAFVSARAFGCVMASRAIKSDKPRWFCKIQIPLFYPIFNDKITMRIWHKRYGTNANMFIANIPEHPSASDDFNIQQILGKDGKIKARWINLYGTSPLNRSEATKSLQEGTEWLGRVLIAMNIVSTERPQLLMQVDGPIRDPPASSYQLWVDIYELADCDFLEQDSQCYITATCGPYTTEPAQLKYKHKTEHFHYKQVQIPALTEMELPQDKAQVPDIFINLYLGNAKDENGIHKRIAYLRLPVKNCLNVKPKPAWYRLGSPYNDTIGMKCGMLLCNVQYLKFEEEPEHQQKRVMKSKAGKTMYRFYYQILQGFELGSSLPEDKHCCRVEIRIGDLSADYSRGGFLCTKNKDGKFPIWNKIGWEMISLDKELTFESDMRVTVINKQKRFFGDFSNFIIGDFAVPLASISKYCEYPQFFNVINSQGLFVGQVLANFWLKEYTPTAQQRRVKGFKDFEREHTDFLSELIQKVMTDVQVVDNNNELEDKSKLVEIASQQYQKVDITFSLLGIRNLKKAAIKPRIRLRLTNQFTKNGRMLYKKGHVNVQYLEEIKEELKLEQTQCPNFGIVFKFKGIQLPKDPLCWPYLELDIYDENKDSLFGSGCEECGTTISLLDFANDEFIGSEKEYAQQQLLRNQDSLHMVQKQIPARKFMASKGLIFEPQNLLKQTKGGVDMNMPEGQQALENQYQRDGSVLPRLSDNRIDRGGQKTVHDLFNAFDDQKNEEKLQDIVKKVRYQSAEHSEQEFDLKESDDFDSADELEDFLKGATVAKAGQAQGAEQAGPKDLGIQVGTEASPNNWPVDLCVADWNKSEEKSIRESKEKELEEYIHKLKEKIEDLEDVDQEVLQYKKTKIRMKIYSLREEIGDLENEEMNDDRFWGLAALGSGPAFDYGRDILKDGENMEKFIDNNNLLPYKRFPLFAKSEWFKGPSPQNIVQVSGILRSGVPTGASLKGMIKIREAEEEPTQDEKEEEHHDPAEHLETEQETLNREPQDEEVPIETESEKTEPDCELSMSDSELDEDDPCFQKIPEDKEDYEKILEECKQSLTKYPYSMMKTRFLNEMNHDRKLYKVRLYLLTCQNLTATSTVMDLKSALAGATALSSANPYPVIKVGTRPEGKLEKTQVNERDSYSPNDLNPQFYRFYEFDCYLPEDWQLKIQIMDRRFISYADDLIGETIVDLEDRMYSNALMTAMKSVDGRLAKIKEIKGSTQFKKSKDKAYTAKIEKLYLELMEQKTTLKEQNQYLVPVEFRELVYPGKGQAQGMAEMWVEVLTAEDATKVPIAKMLQIKKSTFEIRLVIWETRFVPLVDGSDVDIWVKVVYDPTGRPEDIIEKRTDVHNNSKTGYGEFNWRMKFPLEMPCEFPRLTFYIHDAGALVDEAIGQSTLNLKRTCEKLEKEDFIQTPKVFLVFQHPNKPDEEKGICKIELSIVSEDEAKGSPVGDAQEEPNENPYLKKPWKGRGFADQMSGFSINLDINFNPFGPYIYVILAIVILGLLIAAGIMLK